MPKTVQYYRNIIKTNNTSVNTAVRAIVEDYEGTPKTCCGFFGGPLATDLKAANSLRQTASQQGKFDEKGSCTALDITDVLADAPGYSPDYKKASEELSKVIVDELKSVAVNGQFAVSKNGDFANMCRALFEEIKTLTPSHNLIYTLNPTVSDTRIELLGRENTLKTLLETSPKRILHNFLKFNNSLQEKDELPELGLPNPVNKTKYLEQMATVKAELKSIAQQAEELLRQHQGPADIKLKEAASSIITQVCNCIETHKDKIKTALQLHSPGIVEKWISAEGAYKEMLSGVQKYQKQLSAWEPPAPAAMSNSSSSESKGYGSVVTTGYVSLNS